MKKRLSSLFLALIMIVFSAGPADIFASSVSSSDVSPTDVSGSDQPSVSSADPSVPGASPTAQPMRDINAFDLVRDMKLGWNLGESLDSWSSDAGYDDYQNAGAYQMLLTYTDSTDGILNVSLPQTFKEDNTIKIQWNTDMIVDSDAQSKLGTIGFEIWNLTVEEPTEITVNIKTATLKKKKNGKTHVLKDLLGEHTLTISRYGTVSFNTTNFPSHLTKTLGVQGSYFTIEAELVDFPQATYSKSQYFETLWNNPLTTYDMIRQLKASGFNAVRIPITYFNHINSFVKVSDTDAVTKAQSETIDAEWLERIKELVDFCISQDMYCIIDVHNDGSTTGWLRVNTKYSDAVRAKYERLWRQVAEYSKDYNDYLLFEGFSELTDEKNTWNFPGEEACQWVNDLNQLFVDTVRSTGSNNRNRFLLVSTYAAATDQQTLNAFKLPKDSASDRLIVSVHAYTPAAFSWAYEDKNEITKWGAQQDYDELDALFTRLNSRFISKGTPVLITEFGSVEKLDTGIGSDYAPLSASDVSSTDAPSSGSVIKTAATTAAKVSASDVSASDASANDVSASDVSASDANAPKSIGDVALLAIEQIDDSAAGNIASRIRHAQYYVQKATEYGITCFWWDAGDFFNREELRFNHPSIAKAMVEETSTHISKTVVAPVEDQYFTGSPVMPTLNITASVISTVSGADVTNTIQLVEGTDYKVNYLKNINKGTATAIITGYGDYSGVTYTTFNIVDAPIVSEFLKNVFSITGDKVNDFLIWGFTLPIFITLAVIAYINTRKERERLRKLAVVEQATNEAMQEIIGNSDDDFYDDDDENDDF
ncbi:MAG: glycoside hydrolase family 5 protein [Clostridia bacterium]|nr:glycoside hydrolase family 5 protein [Clostridia bacterium]